MKSHSGNKTYTHDEDSEIIYEEIKDSICWDCGTFLAYRFKANNVIGYAISTLVLQKALPM